MSGQGKPVEMATDDELAERLRVAQRTIRTTNGEERPDVVGPAHAEAMAVLQEQMRRRHAPEAWSAYRAERERADRATVLAEELRAALLVVDAAADRLRGRGDAVEARVRAIRDACAKALGERPAASPHPAVASYDGRFGPDQRALARVAAVAVALTLPLANDLRQRFAPQASMLACTRLVHGELFDEPDGGVYRWQPGAREALLDELASEGAAGLATMVEVGRFLGDWAYDLPRHASGWAYDLMRNDAFRLARWSSLAACDPAHARFELALALSEALEGDTALRARLEATAADLRATADAVDRAWLLARQRGETVAHPDPERAAAYERIGGAIAGIDLPGAPPGWEAGVLAEVDASEARLGAALASPPKREPPEGFEADLQKALEESVRAGAEGDETKKGEVT